jgi:4-oxalocrotonate tautomerase
MPMIIVRFAAPKIREGLKPAIAAALAGHSSRILRKDAKVTAVLVEEAAMTDWFCGGRSLAEQNLASFWLDIHVTDGTNTKEEKTDFIAAAFRTMGELLGPLHEESYVHVDEVRADGYGFGGLSQELRYAPGKLKVPPVPATFELGQLRLP